MAYVVTFEDLTPSPRFDALAWTTLRISESADVAGVYTTIDTITLSPVDADPTQPLARNVTTDNATMASGWYKVTFLDVAGDEQTLGPFQHQPSRSNYTPGVGDVGALLRARTRDSDGNEVGTFTDKTRPTATQAERLIDMAASLVGTTIGYDVPTDLWPAAANLITLRAAMFVELSYFPEQVRAQASPYQQYKLLADEAIEGLKKAKLNLPALLDNDTAGDSAVQIA